MQIKNTTQIRRAGLSKINQLVRAHRHLPDLRGAFAEWESGEIFVCKKTGDFRYRYGKQSKSVTAWNGIAREVFASPASFAFAAMVLAPTHNGEQITKPAPRAEAKPADRANVIQLARAA